MKLEIPVRWGDMDAFRHVNNTVFFQYCESARVAIFDALELDRFQSKETDGPGLVAANLNFRRQMRYPGTVRVDAHITEIGRKSFTISYRLTDASDESLLADGDSVCVWVDYEGARALPLPEALVQAMRDLEENPDL